MRIPFDLATAERLGQWRDGLRWPIAQSAVSKCLESQMEQFLCCLGDIDDKDWRDAAVLCGHALLARARALAAAALAIQAASRQGHSFLGGPPELAHLRGESTEAATPGMGEMLLGLHPLPKLASLRALARTLSWTPPARVRNLFNGAPAALALSHNAILRDYARRSTQAIHFTYPMAALLEARRRQAGPDARNASAREVASHVAHAVSELPDIDPPLAQRLRKLVEPLAVGALGQAHADLAELKRFSFPEQLLSATGGYYPSRAIGIEQIRRGGDIIRFDHGGATGMIDAGPSLVLREFAVSSRYVVATPAVIPFVSSLGVLDDKQLLHRTQVIGHTGDPSFRDAARAPRSPHGQRPRVVYAPTVLLGFRQLLPSHLPDLVYLDWQIRLAKMLSALPIDLLCKPHPEGILRGRPHPLTAVSRTSTRLFEKEIPNADIFVFDYAPSTAFWKSVCTDRRVVYVNLSVSRFSPAAEPLIRRRCRVIDARFDEHQLPQISSAELESALFDEPELAEPSVFRRVLAGAA